MSNKIYTDRDIQEYLDGNFNGDHEDFELFVEQHPEARKTLEDYRQLYLLMSTQDEIIMNRDLPLKVINQITVKKYAGEGKGSKYIQTGLILILLFALVFVIYSAGGDTIGSLFTSGTIVLSSILVGVSTWLFARLEIRKKEKKYQEVFRISESLGLSF